ncbi:hypothetical protein HMPREF9129_0224 [Peptoniphilus indolicus ATCC 29427]|uniref:Uncharacterized protein n=1 Tax=Peptoniphilus indolicus ATCC 29427 TaxID=997350 RepID=G4D1E4_9FIRM|nr:hypothetical protein HMPREF9129_0224 [Peptoniphilus indolicus ATCC 29427]
MQIPTEIAYFHSTIKRPFEFLTDYFSSHPLLHIKDSTQTTIKFFQLP